MTSTARDALRSQLIDHEGERLTVYTCPAGYPTIGVGRNLIGTGISQAESRYLLDNDITRCINEAVNRFPWFPDLDEVRQRAVIDLIFNMGAGRLSTFTVTLSCFARGNYAAAADALQQSKWYGQVGQRAKRIVAMVRTGIDPGMERA
jgi:lysozyme